MFAVVVYTVYVALNFITGAVMLASRGWKNYYIESDYPFLGLLFTLVVNGLLYWWIISSVGMIPAAIALIFLWIYSAVGGTLEILILGNLRITLVEFLLFTPVYAFALIGLWSAVLT